MRTKRSWAIAIAFFSLFMIAASYCLNYMELPLESDLGVIITFLAGLIAHKVYLFIKQIEPSDDDRLTSNCWIGGLTLIMVLNGLIYKAFEYVYSDLGTYLRIGLQIASIAGTLWIFKQVYENKKAN